MEKLKRLSVRITDEEYLILEELANEYSTSISNFVRSKLFFERVENNFKEETKNGFSEDISNNKNQKEFIEELSTAVAQKINGPENTSSASEEIKEIYSEEEKKNIQGINKAINKEATFVNVKSKDWTENAKGFQKIADRLSD